MSAGNQVFLGVDGVVRNVYRGDQVYDDVKAVERETLAIAAKLRAEGSRVLILADLRDLGRSSAGSRRASREAIDALQYDRIALFGGSVFNKHLANLIIRSSGKGDRVRYHEGEEHALAWLKTP